MSTLKFTDAATRIDRAKGLPQPYPMQTDRFVRGPTPMNGHDAWAIMRAALIGDIDTARGLIGRDPNLVHADYDYEHPLSLAVLGGHEEMARLLIDAGADPGRSRSAINDWYDLQERATERAWPALSDVLSRAMTDRFKYAPDYEDLSHAVFTRRRDKMAAVLKSRPHLSVAADAMGNTAIHWAVLTRQISQIPYFIMAGMDINARRMDGRSALDLVLDYMEGGGHGYWFKPHSLDLADEDRDLWAVADQLIDFGAARSLSTAAAMGDEVGVRHFLEVSSEAARTLDVAWHSPLSMAAAWGRSAVVDLLLAAGADPNMPEVNAPRGAALFKASAGNQVETARLLLEAGADPNADYDSSGCCLDIVCHKHPHDCKAMQDVLISYGAKTPIWGMDAGMMKEAMRADPQWLKDPYFQHLMFHQDGEDLIEDALTVDPSFVETVAILPRDAAAMDRLLKAGLHPDTCDWLGTTLMHRATERNDTAIVRRLLAAGASIDAIDFRSGGAALATAARSGHEEMCAFLLARHADPNLADGPWALPVRRSVVAGHGRVADLLTNHGAVLA